MSRKRSLKGEPLSPALIHLIHLLADAIVRRSILAPGDEWVPYDKLEATVGVHPENAIADLDFPMSFHVGRTEAESVTSWKRSDLTAWQDARLRGSQANARRKKKQ